MLKTFRKSLYRQVALAVRIYGSQATIVLNSKVEWHQPSIDRVVVTRDLPERQQVRRIGALKLRKKNGGSLNYYLGRRDPEGRGGAGVASFPCQLCQVRIKTAEVAFRQRNAYQL